MNVIRAITIILLLAFAASTCVRATDLMGQADTGSTVYLPVVRDNGPPPRPQYFFPPFDNVSSYTVLEWYLPTDGSGYSVCWQIRIFFNDGTMTTIPHCEEGWSHEAHSGSLSGAGR